MKLLNTGKFAFFVTLLFVFSASAQSVKHNAVKTPVFKDKYDGSTFEEAQDDGNGGTVIIRSLEGSFIAFPKGYMFEHFDPGMKKIKEYFYDNKQAYILGAFITNEQLNVVEIAYDKTIKSYVWYLSVSPLSEFNFTRKKLFDVKCKETIMFGSNEFGTWKTFDMVMSADKSSFGIIINMRRTEELNRIYVFDAAGEQKLMHNFTSLERKGYQKVLLSNDGNTFYMLAKVATDETKDKKEGGEYEFRLFGITKDGLEEVSFSIGEHYIPFLNATLYDDKIVCTGFYSDKKDYLAKGICFFEIDPKTLIISKTKYNEYTSQFRIDKYGKDKDKEIKFQNFKDLRVTPEGNYIFFAEEQSYKKITSGNNISSYTEIKRYFDDIICAKLDTNGNMIWARNINKRQSTKGDTSYLSYTPLIQGEDSYVFINTDSNPDVLSEGRIEFGQSFFTSDSHLNIIKIDNTGYITYQRIKEEEKNIPFMVSNGKCTPGNVYFFGQDGSKKQLLKVSL